MWCVEFHEGICMHSARSRRGLAWCSKFARHAFGRRHEFDSAGETAESRGAVGGDDSATDLRWIAFLKIALCFDLWCAKIFDFIATKIISIASTLNAVISLWKFRQLWNTYHNGTGDQIANSSCQNLMNAFNCLKKHNYKCLHFLRWLLAKNKMGSE